MSYILDALRKSEQQRQATQPETVTDRLLVNPSQPKQKLTKWFATLVIGNLLVMVYLIWFFNQKTTVESKSLEIVKVVSGQKALPVQSEPSLVPQAVIVKNEVAEKQSQATAIQSTPKSSSPSIAQLLEEKETIRKVEVQRSTKQIPIEKPVIVKKERSIPKITTSTFKSEPAVITSKKPTRPTLRKSTPELAKLPYEIRNGLPKLTINVFSYAHQPEDRFVIIDMVKYRVGQRIKDLVKLKEIRPDSIVLEHEGATFTVERP